MRLKAWQVKVICYLVVFTISAIVCGYYTYQVFENNTFSPIPIFSGIVAMGMWVAIVFDID